MAVTDNPAATRLTRPDISPGQLFIAGHWREAGEWRAYRRRGPLDGPYGYHGRRRDHG